MENVRFDTTNTEVQMTMVIKLHQIQRESLSALVYQNIEDYLNERLWKQKTPRTLNVAVNDVMSITASDLVKFLSQQAIIKGHSESLADYADLFGGK